MFEKHDNINSGMMILECLDSVSVWRR